MNLQTNDEYIRPQFEEQWYTFCYNCSSNDALNRFCKRGALRNSPFRSTAWGILLGSLPLNKEQWLLRLQKNRESYKLWKEKIPVNPREEVFEMDLGFNNPLSLQSDSPWQRYFEDQEIRDIISKDVHRTFPEVSFFASDSIREMMSAILFIYARRNPKISYRQGMHEILAPLLFVRYADRQSFEHFMNLKIKTQINQSDMTLLETLHNPSFIEHDTYDLFSKAMNIVHFFYNVSDEKICDQQLRKFTAPFSFENEKKTTASWIEKIDIIYDKRLRHIDSALWYHLTTLEISPRLFGLRWLRLLFGREFPFPDLLFLWDVIFSDGPSFGIIDDIFVAMLIEIRSLLLNADYSTAMQFLMRYPPIADVHAFVQYCLYLRSPKEYPKPASYNLTNFSHITVAGKPHPNQERRDLFNSYVKKVNGKQLQKGLPLMRLNSYSAQSSPQHIPQNTGESCFGESLFHTNSYNTSSLNEVEMMKEQVSILQSNLNDKDLVSRMASSSILKLIPEVDVLDANQEKKTFITSELKHIADVLSRSTVSESTIRSVPLKVDANVMRGAVEVAMEAGSPLRPREPSPLRPRPSSPFQPHFQSGSFRHISRSISRSLCNENELKELHFDRKKNF